MSASSKRVQGWEIMVAICGTECPSCEKLKGRGFCFCDACYLKLTPEVKSRIKNGLRILSGALRDGLRELE